MRAAEMIAPESGILGHACRSYSNVKEREPNGARGDQMASTSTGSAARRGTEKRNYQPRALTRELESMKKDFWSAALPSRRPTAPSRRTRW